MFIRKRVLRFGFDQLIRDVLPFQGLPHSNSPLINTVQSPSINYSASDVAVIPQFNSGTFGFHRNRSFPLPPSILLFPKPVESARFARSFRRAVPRDRPAKLETRSSLGSPLYKYHTLLSASRLVAREHRGERGGGEGRGGEPASWAVALGAKVTRPPSALSRPLRSPRHAMDKVHLFYHTNPFVR